MHRSRHATPRHRKLPAKLPLTAAIYLAFGAAFAQDAAPAAQDTAQQPPATPAAQQTKEPVLETIVVTAQKRSENVQKVPISIQVLGQAKLDELDLKDFNDYAAYVPALSYDTGEGGGT